VTATASVCLSKENDFEPGYTTKRWSSERFSVAMRMDFVTVGDSESLTSKPNRLVGGVACRWVLDYHGRTMVQRRAGTTVKVSVSLDRKDVAALKRRARESYDGNLSAAFAEAARWIRQREARSRLIDKLGGPTLTPESALAIDAEQQGGPRYEPKKSRRKRAA
jgi:hypothetical protein